ncbi:hypothetical protein UlMin_023555 [Ulmus minor]
MPRSHFPIHSPFRREIGIKSISLFFNLPLRNSPRRPSPSSCLARFRPLPSSTKDEQLLEGMPMEHYIDECQAQQKEKTEELHQSRRDEEEEEERKVEEYHEIGTRLKGYPEEDVRKARILVSSLISVAKEVEERIEEAIERGEFTELVLMVIWNRLDLTQRDDEKDAIRSLDLLYKRVEAWINRHILCLVMLEELLAARNDGYEKQLRFLKLKTTVLLKRLPFCKQKTTILKKLLLF